MLFVCLIFCLKIDGQRANDAMERQLTPQEKKRHSLSKDCRNCYGENDKASRQAIRLRKRWVNRSYRRSVQQKLQQVDDFTQEKVSEVARKQWKKIADQPLGEMLLIHHQRDIEYQLWLLYQKDNHVYDALIAFLDQQNLSHGHYEIIVRRALDCMFNRNVFGLALAEPDLDLLNEFLQSDSQHTVQPMIQAMLYSGEVS